MADCCSTACGFCGRCTAAWELEPDDDLEPQESDEDQQRRENHEAAYLAAVHAWFAKSDKAV
jgi:hypothetical protein